MNTRREPVMGALTDPVTHLSPMRPFHLRLCELECRKVRIFILR